MMQKLGAAALFVVLAGCGGADASKTDNAVKDDKPTVKKISFTQACEKINEANNNAFTGQSVPTQSDHEFYAEAIAEIADANSDQDIAALNLAAQRRAIGDDPDADALWFSVLTDLEPRCEKAGVLPD